jgi:3-oxoacyl-[acyl-carrier protein] reductase
METKVAVITGAGRGIGKATAIALAKEGFSLVIDYLSSEEEAQHLVKDINQFSHAISVRADVSDLEQVKRLLDETLNTYGRVDVLVNNAGAIVRPGDWRSMTDDTWHRTLDINLLGVFNCIKTFAPVFLERKKGKIINMTSTYGILGAAPVIAYTAAKAGVINLTRAFAKELAPFITVNAVCPGNIDTEMTTSAGEEFIRSVIDATPLKRLGTPEDVANAILFLASSQADFITGQVLVVDGGHMLR